MNASLKLASSMFIFGSMGLFVRAIDLPVSVIAVGRGVFGLAALAAAVLVLRRKFSRTAVMNNALLLAVSGLALGIDWIFLFEAYKRTTIAAATVTYYIAPVILVAVSPVFLKEKLSLSKVMCIMSAVAGMILVSGIFSDAPGPNGLSGIFCGLAAAVCFAVFTLLNKFLKDISSLEATIAQLGAATVVILPYALFTGGFSSFSLNVSTLLLLVVLGAVHTGLAFYLYFSSIHDLKAQSIAVFSYVDPVAAILLSSLLLKEEMGLLGIIGTIMVIGSTLISELASKPPRPLYVERA